MSIYLLIAPKHFSYFPDSPQTPHTSHTSHTSHISTPFLFLATESHSSSTWFWIKPVTMYSSHFGTLSALLVVSSGHFVLNYPPSLGFDDSVEATGPCGGFPIVFNASDTSVPVDGFTAAMFTTHPQTQWLLRATLSKAEPFNWTNLLPVVDEIGPGNFCLPSLKAPAEFAGKAGLIQVTQAAADGALYQARIMPQTKLIASANAFPYSAPR